MNGDLPEIDVPANPNAVDLPEIDFGSVDPNASKYTVEEDSKSLAVKFGVIGAGQGGSRVADAFWSLGYRRVCAINTTDQDFLGLTLPKNKQMVLTQEGGAGKEPSKGAEAVTKNTEEVMNLMRHSFGEDIDHIMISACAGGGSGTGAAEVLPKLAKYYMRQLGKPEKVGMIVSLPKYSEGGTVQANAYNLMAKLIPMAQSGEISPLIVVDNQSIHTMFPNVPAKTFWQTANKNTVGLFDIFNVLAAQKSAYTTFDKADYRSMLSSGIIIYGATKIDSYQRDTDISDGLRNNLQRSLLAGEFDLTKATHMAGILAAPDQILSVLPQSHIELAFSTMERILGGESRKLTCHQGVYEAAKFGLYVYTMVGGLSFPEKRLAVLKARAGL